MAGFIMARALVLDFDGSVLSLPETNVVSLRQREETIRFACSRRALRDLSAALSQDLDVRPPVVFLGSGDFHHVTLPLIERLGSRNQQIQVVVFDNHPDNMLYPFGVHCGSWVWHVSRLPFVSRVHVAGITSPDVEGGHVWENHLPALRSGKVVYWCVQRNLRGLERAGVRQSHTFPSIAEMLDGMTRQLDATREPIYLSIDKDVLSRDEVQTNWDQGVMGFEELQSAVRLLRGRLIGSDVVGDVSVYRYQSWFKRLLSGLDGQPDIAADSLAAWQSRHRQVNQQLLSLLSSASADA